MITAAVRDLASASGLELARLIDSSMADLDRLSDADRLEVVKATARLDAWTATMRAKAILAVHDSARDDIAATTAELLTHDSAASAAGPSHAYDDKRLLHRRVGIEVALVLSISTVAADREVDLALGLRQHPQVRQALADGLIHPAQARVLLDGADLLDDPVNQAKLVTALLGPGRHPRRRRLRRRATAPSSTRPPTPTAHPSASCAAAGRSVWSLAPGAAARRSSAARSPTSSPTPCGRRPGKPPTSGASRSTPSPTSPPSLRIYAPAPAAAAAYRNLDRTARAAQATGDTRTLDQLRTDIAHRLAHRRRLRHPRHPPGRPAPPRGARPPTPPPPRSASPSPPSP